MIPIKINADFSALQAVAGRDGQRIKREAGEDVGEDWHENLLPEHFKRSSPAKYRHQPRKEKYKRSKERSARNPRAKNRAVLGGVIDNVFSGESKAALSQYANITARAGKTTVTMHPPRYFWMRAPGSTIDKAAETTTVADSEVPRMERVYRDGMERRIQARLNR